MDDALCAGDHAARHAPSVAALSAPFAANGLCFIQSPGFNENLITVTTRIMHTSGEWLEGTTCLPPTKNDAQGYGSAITYAKRYGLQAMAGVPSVDDDGQAAVKQAAPVKAVAPSLSATNLVLCTAMKEALESEDFEVVYENYLNIGSGEEQAEVWFYFNSKKRMLKSLTLLEAKECYLRKSPYFLTDITLI